MSSPAWSNATILTIEVPEAPVLIRDDIYILGRFVCKGDQHRPTARGEYEGFRILKMIDEEDQSGDLIKKVIYERVMEVNRQIGNAERVVIATTLDKIPPWKCWGSVEALRYDGMVEILLFDNKLLGEGGRKVQDFLRYLKRSYSLSETARFTKFGLRDLIRQMNNDPDSEDNGSDEDRDDEPSGGAVGDEEMGKKNSFFKADENCPFNSVQDMGLATSEASKGEIGASTAVAAFYSSTSEGKTITPIWRSRFHAAVDLRIPGEDEDSTRRRTFWKAELDKVFGLDPATPLEGATEAGQSVPTPGDNIPGSESESAAPSSEESSEEKLRLAPDPGNPVDFVEVLATTLKTNKEIRAALISFSVERLAPMLQRVQDAAPNRLSVQTLRSVLNDLLTEANRKVP